MADRADRELAKEKAARLLKRRGSQSTINSDAMHKPQIGQRKYQGSMSTVSYQDEPAHDEIRGHVKLENTFQLGPAHNFPSSQVKGIIRDVLEGYLSEQTYEPEICRQITKTLSEVVKARVKEMQIPRYKVVALITIGSLKDQGVIMGSRCLWDANVDTFSSYEFKNRHLFAVGTVYGIYAE